MPFYCHLCESAFELAPTAIATQPVCAICGSDFVEQIDDDSENDQNNLSDTNNTSNDPALGFALLTRMLAGMNATSPSDSSPRSSGFTAGFALSSTNGRFDTPVFFSNYNNSSNSNSNPDNNATTAQNEDESTEQQQQQEQEEPSDPASQHRQRISNLVQLLMRLQMQHEGFTAVSLENNNENTVDLSIGGGSGASAVSGGPARVTHPLFRLFGGIGNPRDYVFGQTGIDDIVTQLMEQAN
ncbi:hypothetical protein HK100_010310, partial [Physocladia obscura]